MNGSNKSSAVEPVCKTVLGFSAGEQRLPNAHPGSFVHRPPAHPAVPPRWAALARGAGLAAEAAAPAGRAGEHRCGGVSSKATRQTPVERDGGQGQGWGQHSPAPHAAQPLCQAALDCSPYQPALSSPSAPLPHDPPPPCFIPLPAAALPSCPTQLPTSLHRVLSAEVLSLLQLRPDSPRVSCHQRKTCRWQQARGLRALYTPESSSNTTKPLVPSGMLLCTF